ncbi:MAG: SOS response-associated peptidase [bacterium]|nr:SOS response-associated peptidase [bacterium]
MCGRFNVDFEEQKELKEILKELNQKHPGNRIKHGDVYPTDTAAILRADEAKIVPELSVWGFPGFQGKGVIINARSETVFEKRMFKDSMVTRRCLIPMTGFYEWDEQKNKYLFKDGADVMYVGGIYNEYKGQNHFVILTTAANDSMREVHNRMPLIIAERDRESWLKEREKTNSILSKVPEALKRLRVG